MRNPVQQGFLVVLWIISWSMPVSWAQSYPAKPIRMMVGYEPGGAADITARVVAQKLSEVFGQAVIRLENRPGGGGAIANEEGSRFASRRLYGADDDIVERFTIGPRH